MAASESQLAKHPFFKSLEPSLLEIFSACATPVTYEPEQKIYREGEEANQFLLLIRGIVAVELHLAGRGNLVIQTVGAGEVLGWSWLFPPYRRRFDARVIQKTNAYALDGKYLREKADSDHRLGYELLKRFSKTVVERLQATRIQLLDVYGKSV
jgi:CRP-like cAMP-binding protein